MHPDICGPCSGHLVETIGYYADDMILYLEDSSPSLHVIEEFGVDSGLHINWSKSQILPLDLYPLMSSSTNLPLCRVDSIQYLGVQVTRELKDYIVNNNEL